MKIQFIISFLLFSTCLAGCIEEDVEEIIVEIEPIIEIENFTEACIEYDEL